MDDELRKLRVRFQRALLGLLRTEDRNTELIALEETLQALSARAANFEAAAVWTRCREWIESLRTSEQRPKPGYIRFLRMVDQSLKVWLDSGQAQFESREIPKLRAELAMLTRGESQQAEPASAKPDGDVLVEVPANSR